MGIAEKNESFFRKHHKLLAALLAVLLPYAGFNGYQEVKKATSSAAPVTTNVTISAPSAPSAPAVDKYHTDTQINDLIESALKKASKAHDCKYHAVC